MESSNNRYKRLLKDTVIFAFGGMGSKVILFFMVPLYTNCLTSADYGIADLVSTFSQLIIPVVSLMINDAVIRFGMKKGEHPENVVLVSFVVLAFTATVTVCITPFFSFYEAISPWKWYLCIQIIFTSISATVKAYLKIKERNRAFALIDILQTAVLATANVIFLVGFKSGVKGYLCAEIIAVGTSACVAVFVSNVFRDLKSASFDKTLLRKMIIYSSPLILNNISWWVVHSTDKIMIEAMIGASVLGIYTAATKIPSLINVFTGIFSQAWGLSSIREFESSNEKAFFSSVFSAYSTFTVAVGICITAIIKPFMSVYVGSGFQTSWLLTPLLLTAAVFYSFSTFFGSLFSAAEKTVDSMLSTIVCAITNVVVNFIFIPIVGVWGAVIGTVVSYFVIAHFRMISIRKYVPISVNIPRYIMNILILITQAILVSLDFHIYIVSISAIICFLVINYKEIKTILNMVYKKFC